MREHFPDPTIHQVEPIDTEQECWMYRGSEPSKCHNVAKYVFVYDKLVADDEVGKPDNCLACEECVPKYE